MKTKNEFLLKGGITSIHSARTVSRMVVATDGGGLTAFVNVVFFPDVDISNFKLGDRVTVKGHVQFQILRDSAGNTTGYRQTLVADSIELTPRLLAAFIKEDSNLYNGGVQADENEILLFGRVSHVFDTTNGAVIIDNLIQYGGFDFVVCDTGNNTRDCSIISLEKADEVLLVVTQDVNTANCNSSFLSTMRKVGFDMNKIRLVINKARPAKIVAISTEELEEAFVNPNTGKPYPCITRIKDNNEVKHANNLGEPLVYNSSHEFTRSIGIIAKEIIGDHFVLGEPEKKKGFFKKLFGKK